MGILDWFKRGKKHDADKPDRTVVNHEEQAAPAPPKAPSNADKI